ncbi:MAG: hypothetical protein FJY07_07990, partial [Bacteroidetes bacterium]|nr:hypothetical protein [Bacteroidota bacterium]
MKTRVTKLFLTILMPVLLPDVTMSQWVTHHDPLFMTDIPQPDLGASYTDPKTGIPVTRITDALNSGEAGT